MKYKVGDKIKVHTLDYFEKYCDKSADEFSLLPSRYLFTKDMYNYCNKYVTIDYVDNRNECYNIKEDNGKYYWCDWMLDEYRFNLCQFLRVEEEQEFKVDDLKYKIKNNKLLILESDGWHESVLLFNRFMDNINNYDIVVKYEPKRDDICYIPDIYYSDLYREIIYHGSTPMDKWLKERELIFRTKEEAIECAKKMLGVIE